MRTVFSLLVVSGFVFFTETSLGENVVSLRQRGQSMNSHAGSSHASSARASSRPVANAYEYIPFNNPLGQNPISPSGINYPSGIGSFNPTPTPYNNSSFSPWGYSNNSLYNPIYGGGLYNPIYGGGYGYPGYNQYPGYGSSFPGYGYPGYSSYPGYGGGFGYGYGSGYPGYGYVGIEPWLSGPNLWQDPYLYSGSTYGLYGSGYGSYGLGGYGSYGGYGFGGVDPYGYGGYGYGYGNYGLNDYGFGFGDGSGYGFGSGPWGGFSFNW